MKEKSKPFSILTKTVSIGMVKTGGAALTGGLLIVAMIPASQGIWKQPQHPNSIILEDTGVVLKAKGLVTRGRSHIT